MMENEKVGAYALLRDIFGLNEEIMQYILILLWVGVVGLVSPLFKARRKELVLGKEESRYTSLFAAIVVIPLILMVANRGTSIGDSYNYAKSLSSAPDSLLGLIQYLPEVSKDKGFSIFTSLVKMVIGDNVFVYFLIIAAIQAGLLAIVYRKYSPAFLTSVFLFLASTDYISWMFNGLRQFIAAVLIFSATGLILRRKWLPTIVIIVLASTFHQSALLMIPVVLIAVGPAWNNRTLLFLAAALVAVTFVDQFTNILETMMQETQYSTVVSDWEAWNDDGTNALRVLVYSIPTILSVIGIRYIKNANDPLVNLCTNMSIVSTGLYIISMFTSGIFMGRLPIYASLYNYILLPWEIEHMFTKRSARLVRVAMIGAYLCFYVYQMHISWSFF